MTYFANFPTIKYNGITISNLLVRAKLTSTVETYYTNYLPYSLEFPTRPDSLSYDYYGDVGFDWLVMIANQIIDPYFDWYMSDAQLKNWLVIKYGSIANTMDTVKYYERINAPKNDPYTNVKVNVYTWENVTLANAETFGSIDIFTYENDRNDRKRALNLVDTNFAQTLESELQTVLNK